MTSQCARHAKRSSTVGRRGPHKKPTPAKPSLSLKAHGRHDVEHDSIGDKHRERYQELEAQLAAISEQTEAVSIAALEQIVAEIRTKVADIFDIRRTAQGSRRILSTYELPRRQDRRNMARSWPRAASDRGRKESRPLPCC
jgi:hypothetical protein